MCVMGSLLKDGAKKGSVKTIKTKDLVAATVHQGTKALSKVSKLVKAFLVLKCTRRIAEAKKTAAGESLVEDLVKELQSIKEIDHAKMGIAILESRIQCNTPQSVSRGGGRSIGSDDVLENYSSAATALLCPKICRQFMQHKKLLEAIAFWKSKMDSAILAPPPRLLEAGGRAKGGGTKAMAIKPRVGMKERTKAVFLNSLEEESREERVGNRKAAQSLTQSGKTPKQDLSPYMAPGDRLQKSTRNVSLYKSAAASSSTSSSSSLSPVYASNRKPPTSYSLSHLSSSFAHASSSVHSRSRQPPPKSSANEDDAKLHPSWIAKQQAKSKMSVPLIIKDSNYSMRNRIIFGE